MAHVTRKMQQDNDDEVIIPEKEWEFKEKTLYEFTINLNDERQCTKMHTGLDLRYQSARDCLKKVFENNTWKYFLIPEISMPQAGQMYKYGIPRIHWHGIVMFPNNDTILHHLLVTAIKLADIGRYQFNEYRPKYWPKYCMKYNNLFSKLGYIHNVEYFDDIYDWSKENDTLEIYHKKKKTFFTERKL